MKLFAAGSVGLVNLDSAPMWYLRLKEAKQSD